MGLNYRSRVPTYNLTEGVLQRLAIAAKYLLFREGPIAAAYEAAAFETTPTAPIPDVQIFSVLIGWGKVVWRITPHSLSSDAHWNHSLSCSQQRTYTFG